jgi:lipopolysaccharide/colanic/teichoic acid biosynthesis glycosyltransferase
MAGVVLIGTGGARAAGVEQPRMGGDGLFTVEPAAMNESAKRLLDIVASALGILLLLPLFIVIGLLIKLDSPGPLLFFQQRVGLNGVLFRCWKLRSMYQDAEARKRELMEQNEMAGGTTFKMKRDPRITRVGRFIRKASIDELPQLWNVLVGDMSLVGPRPAVPQEVEGYPARAWNRLVVKPGITCIWQVSGRSQIPFEQQVEMDIEYASRRSMGLDLLLLVKTLPAVLLARGAY